MDSTLFILNESSEPSHHGDVSIFRSLDSLLNNIEAIDVRNNEYYGFTSDGRKISLSAEHNYAPVSATIEKSPLYQDTVKALLHSYLLWLADHGRFCVARKAVEDAASLEDLVELIPEDVVE